MNIFSNKKPTSVSEIMSSFSQTIAQLGELQNAKQTEREEELLVASVAQERAQAAGEEAHQAAVVAENLKKLLNQSDIAIPANTNATADKVA